MDEAFAIANKSEVSVTFKKDINNLDREIQTLKVSGKMQSFMPNRKNFSSQNFADDCDEGINETQVRETTFFKKVRKSSPMPGSLTDINQQATWVRK